jgi:hypothetical protein
VAETVVNERRTGATSRRAASVSGGARSLLRRHWPVLLPVAAAVVLRVLAEIAIYPGIWFSDSNGYVKAAATGILTPTRVSGYALLVSPFWHAGSAAALIALQHAIGIALVVALYALLVRRGAPRWLAALCVVPAAVDAYLIVVEHAIMSETLYHACLAGALIALLWSDRLSVPAAAVGGLLLGYAGVTRSVGVGLVAVFFVYLLARRVGWRPLLGFAAGWLVIAGGYTTLFHHQHGSFAFESTGGRFLYARVAPFADCAKLHGVPVDQRSLCPDPNHRLTTNSYLWSRRSPIRGRKDDFRIRSFALRVVEQQPLDYIRVVARGVVHYFEPGHRIGPNDYPVQVWQFPADPRHWGYPGYRGPIRPGIPRLHKLHPITPSRLVSRMVVRPRLNPGVSRVLHDYQRVVYTYGPLLAACVIAALAALVTRRGSLRLRLDAALVAGFVLAALTIAQALSVFSYRYGLIAALYLPIAAGLGVTALLQGRRPAA